MYNMSITKKLNGKKLDVQYASGEHYRMAYLSDEELRWEFLGELPEGEAPEGTEPFWSSEITEDIYNVNWIEQDGLTVSQILNFRTNTVTAFLTFADDSARGGRDHASLQGEFRLVD